MTPNSHSCDPSVRIDCSDPANLLLVAFKDIQPGQDATFFYPSTEYEMAQPFECWCRSDACIKSISGMCTL